MAACSLTRLFKLSWAVSRDQKKVSPLQAWWEEAVHEAARASHRSNKDLDPAAAIVLSTQRIPCFSVSAGIHTSQN